MRKIGKCLSLLLSLLLAGSGMFHAVLHSAGRCGTGNPRFAVFHPSRSAQANSHFHNPSAWESASAFQNEFCPVCAGFLTGICENGEVLPPNPAFEAENTIRANRIHCVRERRLLPEVRAPPAV